MPSRRRNGEGSIYRDKQRGTYVVEISYLDDLGRLKTKKARARTEKDARQKLRELQDAVTSGANNFDRSTTLNEYIEHWVTDIVPTLGLKPKTIYDYRFVARHWVGALWGKQRLSKIRVVDIDRGLFELAEQGLSRDTIRLVRNSIQRIFRQAIREQIVATNPATDARMPKVGVARQRRAMTEEQIVQLLTHTRGDRLHGPIAIALTTGLRLSEFLNLRWDSVDLDSDRPCLQVQESKTEAGRRTVPLTAYAVEVLAAQRAMNIRTARDSSGMWTEEGYVFPSLTGTRWDNSNFRKLFKQACLDAGIGDWIPHEMRHTAATWLLDNDVHMKKVADQLGHANISTTVDFYGHRSKPADEVTEAFEKLAPSDWRREA